MEIKLLDFDKELSEKKKDKYFELGFARNPFPSTPVPPEPDPDFCVNQEDVGELILGSLGNAIVKGEQSALVLCGDIGTGKSHVVRFFRWNINTKLEGAGEGIAAFVQKPGKNFLQLLGGLSESLGLASFQKALAMLLMGNSSLTEKTKELVKKKYIERKPTGEELDESTIVQELDATIYQLVKKGDISNVLSRLLSDDDETAWALISRGSILKTVASEAGLATAVIDHPVGWFVSMARIFSTAYESFIVFVDELEELIHLRQQRVPYYSDLREMLEYLPPRTVVVFTCDTASFDDLQLEAYPFVRRLKSVGSINPITSLDEAKAYVLEYLTRARLEEEAKDPLFPFSSNVLKEIFKWKGTQGVCIQSAFLTTCYQIFEQWANRGEKKLIGLDEVQSLKGSKV